MTAKALEIRKNKLLSKIALSESEGVIAQIEEILAKEAGVDNRLQLIINKGIQKSISLEQMKLAQNYKGTSYAKIKGITEAMDIREPIEELIAMI